MGACRSYLDLLYLGTVGVQLIGMLVLDFLPFYPAALCKDASSPLHFLLQFRQLYVEMSGDPYARAPAAFPWFEATTYIELMSQFPLAMYIVYKLSSRRPADGPAEIAGLAFACLNAMGSAICSFDLWHQASTVFGPGQQMRLIVTEFGPYTVVSVVMAVDMYTRLLKRVQEPGKTKSQ